MKNIKKEKKKNYRKPTIKTELIDTANATSMGGGGGGGNMGGGNGGGATCNGNTAGGRKDNAGSGCSVLLT
jgi:hypothetical protein